MKPGDHPVDAHLEQLIEQLSAEDTLDTTFEPTDLSQLSKLRRELEMISSQLRTAHANDPYWSEPRCQQSIQAILAIPHELQRAAISVDKNAQPEAVDDGRLSTKWNKPRGKEGNPDCTDNSGNVAKQFGTRCSSGRFRILRLHAKGGLGQVSLALDQELHREVALKEIQAQFSDDRASRERFVLEAEITGGLEHPGIVPVYALGLGTDGCPFYAMRFVQGNSLKQVIEDFHSPENPNRQKPGMRLLALRQLLSRFIDVCNAVEYAHSRGILHRDLKPANIMLGNYGETLVVDWGLAKPMGNQEFPSNDARPHFAMTFTDLEQTQPGSVVGTPGYMSPEQAAGNLDQFSPATDVYSLGVTLRQMLSGQAPTATEPTHRVRTRLLQKRSLSEILLAVRRGDFMKPLAIVSRVPPALNSVCIKAMALRPEDRYASASAIAVDIEHWLADEPVAAHQENQIDKIARWIRRHRAWAMSGAAALAIVAIVATVASFLINGQRLLIAEKERTANQLALHNATLVEEKTKLVEQEMTARRAADHHADAAKRQTKLAERHLYVANMNLAQSAWDNSHVDQSIRLLDLYRSVDDASNSQGNLLGFEWYYLDHCCHSDLSTLRGHTGSVLSVAYRPDGMHLASAGADHAIKIWDAISGRELLTLQGHNQSIHCVAYSPDGKRLASASNDAAVKVWNIDDGHEAMTLAGHRGPVKSVAFSPDGQRLASAGDDGTTILWNLTTQQKLFRLQEHVGPVSSVAFSPDGMRLASGGHDSSIRIWDTATGRTSLPMKGHNNSVFSVAFSPDGLRVASASYDESIKVWDAGTGRELLTLTGHTHPVLNVAFSSDGRRLASASVDQTVRVWDAATGQLRVTLKGHTHETRSVAFSPDGSQLASASLDRTIKLWDVSTVSESLAPFGDAQGAAAVAFSPDGDRVASGNLHQIKVWDAFTGWDLLKLSGHMGTVRSVTFSPNGERLASASEDKTVRIWDPVSGMSLLTLFGHTHRVWSVAFSPDGQRLASASEDQTVKIWNAATGQELSTLKGHLGGVWSVSFSPDGQRLVSASADRTARIWDAAKGNCLFIFKGHTQGVRSVVFSPDGTQFASASEDLSVRVWNSETGLETLTLNGHTLNVTSVAFSPDGQRLASASHDKTVKLWDLASGQESLTLKGHTDAVSAVAFSRDGLRIATASWYDTVKIWDAHPWTPALRNQQQAFRVLKHVLSGLRSSCAQPMSREWLRETIDDQVAISDDVRQRTHELAELYQWRAEKSDEHSLFLNREQKVTNLIRNGSFEDSAEHQIWTPESWRQNTKAASIKEGIAYTGKRSAFLATEIVDDVRLCQDVVVQPDTDYLLCGWVKTEGIQLKQEGKLGANLCLLGSSVEHSQSVTGDRDWTRLTLKFNSGPRISVRVCLRLGYESSTCIGKAWFDDLCLTPLGQNPQ